MTEQTSPAPDPDPDPGTDPAPDSESESQGGPGQAPAAPVDPAAPPKPASGGEASRKPRWSAAGLVIGLLLGLLGFGLVVQMRGNGADEQLAGARPDDLVRILSDLDSRKERLQQEISDLEDSRRQLQSGAKGRDAALAEIKKRADELGILAGTLPAQGPGLTIVIVSQGQPIKAATLLDAVEELRGAGAEAMQVRGEGGTTVRIVASTYFIDHSAGVVVDGVVLAAPYTLEVIGDPQTMQTAMNIPGGVMDSLRQRGGSATVRQSDTVNVATLHPGGSLRYATPVS